MTDLFDVIYDCEECGGEVTVYLGGAHGLNAKRAKKKMQKEQIEGVRARVVPTDYRRYYGGTEKRCKCQRLVFA